MSNNCEKKISNLYLNISFKTNNQMKKSYKLFRLQVRE